MLAPERWRYVLPRASDALAALPGSRVQVRALIAWLAPPYLMMQAPKRWRFVKQLPRNAMGKLNKKELLKELLAAEAVAADSAAR